MARVKGQSGGAGVWRVRPRGCLSFLLAVGSSHGGLIESQRSVLLRDSAYDITNGQSPDAGSIGSMTYSLTNRCIFYAIE
jgi:hypothetical protein